MKSSTILIITSIAICFGMLITYNLSLKAAYDSGVYKKRFNDSEFTAAKNINELVVEGANLISVKVESGEKEGLWVRDRIKQLISVKQADNKFIISLTADGKEGKIHFGTEDLVFVTNSLNKITTEGYLGKGEKFSDPYRYGGDVTVEKLKANQLDLQIGSLTAVYLRNLQLGTLKATVGGKIGYATLEVSEDNQINDADFSIPGIGKLTINNPKIVKTSYNVSDSSTVNLSGSVLNKIQSK